MSPSSMIRIAGGGMTGLTLALRLARRGYPVVVHERDPYLGGLASESALGGVPVERFYHCILPADKALLGLLDELGLSSEVVWNRTRTGFFSGEGLMEMTTIRDLLAFPALKMIDRLRLGWTVAYCGMNRSWRRLDSMPIGPFLRRHGGDRLFTKLWEPLLRAKLGPEYDRFAASFIWATIYRMLSARKESGRAERLGFVRGRYGKVFEALRKSIQSAGGEVLANSRIEGIDRIESNTGNRWSLRIDGNKLPARSVVLCVPAPIAAQWIGNISLPHSAALNSVEYLGVVCETLLLRRSLTPYYVLNPAAAGIPFTGVIEMTNLTGIEEFHRRAVVYLPRYAGAGADVWTQGDEEIHRQNVGGLCRIVPDLAEQDIVAWQIHRAQYVQPVHPVGWGGRIPPVHIAPGLAYLSTAHIHPWPVFNDEVVRLVDTHVDGIVAAIGDAQTKKLSYD